ncbi:hypothetical protein ASPBRDRAFT_130834, partial [Aspergillus brasiliensis CBS 101740]
IKEPTLFPAALCTLCPTRYRCRRSRLADVQCCGFPRHCACLSSSSVLPSMNPKDLLRYLSKPAKYVSPFSVSFAQTSFFPLSNFKKQILSSARPDTFAGIGIFQHEGFYRTYPSLAECQLPQKQIKGLLSQTDIAPLFVWAADSAS